MEREIKKDGIPILDIPQSPEAPPPREMIDMEATFEKLENELKEVITNSDALKKTHLELTELSHILKKAQYFFNEVRILIILHFVGSQLIATLLSRRLFRWRAACRRGTSQTRTR